MKGSIVLSGMDYVTEKFGKEVWLKTLRLCNVKQGEILPFAEIDDRKVECLINTVSNLTGERVEKILEEFGRYWITKGAKTMYPLFYKNVKSAKQFILEINRFHKVATQNTPGARPPSFDYWWEKHNVLILHYHSHRNLLNLAVGAIKGCEDCFKEKLIVEKIPPDKIKVTFSVSTL